MSLNLLEMQQAFSVVLAQFILQLTKAGYCVTLGEAYRPVEMAEIYQKQGKGILNSNHTRRLAIDLNLFKGTQWLNSKLDYEKAGQMWESLSTDDFKCCWGGRFDKPDCDHFSFEFGGIK